MKGCVKIQSDRRADLRLDRLAEKEGFTTKNVMVRVVMNELANCEPRFFWKAMGVFSQFTRRKNK